MIGEFRLHARLGAGGMGQVYLGFSPAGRAVAIKVVHPQLARDQEFLQRFSREVASARAVSGMYTAPVVDSGLNDSPPWLATAFVPGPPLATVVARYGALPETAVWRLAAGLAEALRAVHAAGLVHRDLKPANVLLADDGPHVIDFGISRAFQGTQLTSAGMVVGTPGYMSPEQAEGAPSGPPSDVFSLGCVLAYATTGSAPFGEGSAATILYRIVRSEPDLGNVPANLRQLIEACLRKDAAQRPDHAQLSSMITTLGPATAVTLGSFWPEAVSRVIATEQASQTPAGLTPPGQAAGFGAAATSGMTGAPGLAPRPPVERTPTALATPPGQGSGATGHAPMISDGYYQAAAQPRITPSPVPGSLPPGQQTRVGQPPSGPMTPGYAGQAPGGFAAGTGGAPYQGPPSSPPWPQQPGGAASWPGAGTPGDPGSPDALGQYRLGRRNPMGAEIAQPVRAAVRLMYAGLAATVVALIVSGVNFSQYTKDAQSYKKHPFLYPAYAHADKMATSVSFAVLADLLGLVCWVVIAIAVRRGRGWARVTGMVLLGIYTLVMLSVLANTRSDPGAQVLTLLVWALGVAAAVPLWTQQARAFFDAWRKR
jgi:serine/threonine protein kinase